LRCCNDVTSPLNSELVPSDRTQVLQLCSPTRTSLLSSRYAYNTGLAKGVITNGYPVALRLNESIVAEHFRDAGFSTHAFGKWDVGCAWIVFVVNSERFASVAAVCNSAVILSIRAAFGADATPKHS
jgi:hypothetical protein